MANYNEALNGDLSSNSASPTSLVLSSGSNIVTGSTIGGGNPPGDRDFLTFVVPAGTAVTQIALQDYQWGDGNQSTSGYGNSYFAVTQGNSFPSLTDASTFAVSKLIDNSTAASEIGKDLLEPDVGTAAGPSGPSQLGPGTYSVWYQETGANTTYAFDISLDTPFGQIQFDSNAVQANEAAGTADITLTRTGGSNGAVSVVLNQTGGTAQNSVDYTVATPLTVNFAAGETQKVVKVAIANDTAVEGNETAVFGLTNPTGGAILGTAVNTTLTIVDDDVAPSAPGQLQFSSNAIQVNESAGTADITLTRTGGKSGAVSAVLNQTGGTAQKPDDYTIATPLTVNFADGETQKVIKVAIVNDTLVEGDETALFGLTNPTGGATLGAANTTLTIADDDKVSGGTDKPDILSGGTGNDIILGLSGNDRLSGNEGDDFLAGGSGNDRLFGNAGVDRLWGNNGDDLLDGGAGADILVGGAGRDTFVLRRRDGSDLIRDFQIGKDVLDLRGNLSFGQLTIAQDGTKTLVSVGSNVLVTLKGVQADQITTAQFR
jgi:Ca2+-binding RTX toxin-like protein